MQSQRYEHELDVDRETVSLFNRSIFKTFDTAKRVVDGWELQRYALRTLVRQRDASRRRLEWRRLGVHVPPVIIFSATRRCNLACRGCYAHAQSRCEDDISVERVEQLFEEASELGVSVIVVAGGEPLIRPELLDLAALHGDIIFPVFTNGLLIDQTTALMMRYSRNIVPMISVEGDRATTDARRGDGVYDEVVHRMGLLRNNGVFFGASITVTSENLEQVTSDGFLAELEDFGVKAVIYVEYVPVEAGTEHLLLDADHRGFLEERLTSLRDLYKMVFIDFPGDEEKLGGCLAAGKGFIHVSQSGAVEPCPASPFSDVNLRDVSLKEALNSDLLQRIRGTPHSLAGSSSGCALFDQREWVEGLVEV